MNGTELQHKHVTIFIIDDDDVDVLGIERALKKLKIANPTIRARDGIEALDLLHRNAIPKPFIILLDINMPRMGQGLIILDRFSYILFKNKEIKNSLIDLASVIK